MSKFISRENISRTIDVLKLNSILEMLRSKFIKELRILAYHRVCNPDIRHNNDPGLISATEEQFDWQVSYLKRNYNLISFSDLEKIVAYKEKLPERAVIITFDDGFSDNYFNAYSILKKHRAKATFFVSTGYIGTKNQFWFNQVYRSLINDSVDTLKLDEIGVDCELSSDKKIRQEQIYDVIEKLKQCPNDLRIDLVNIILNKYPSLDNIDPLSLPLSWQQLKEMTDNNMEICSHTVSHPVLTMLSDDDLSNEVVQSKLNIETSLGTKVNAIAYPVGMRFAYDINTIEKVRMANYKFGVSYIAGTNYFNDMQFHDLKRIHIELYTSREMFKSMLSFPELFAVY